MASDHLSEEGLSAYARRVLAPTELLNASDHLAECVGCREKVARMVAESRAQGLSADADNLSYEELVEYLDESIDPLRRRELSERLQHAPRSRMELEDLRKFRDEMDAVAPTQFRGRPSSDDRILIFPRAFTRWALPIAAAIALAGGAIWWSTTSHGTAGAVTLRDGDRAIFLKANGRVRGLAKMPQELMPLVVTAMKGGKMEIPPAIRSLASEREVLAGASDKGSEFQVSRPIATAVRERMPRFRWSAQPGAAQYRIRIVDWDSGEVKMTGNSDGPRTEWTPAEPLEAGKVYQWQVEALRNNEVIARSPTPPEPEARFKILSDNERLRVESVGRSVGGSHLATAVIDVQAGLLDEATDQLRILAKENPNSQIPVRLLAQIERVSAGKENR